MGSAYGYVFRALASDALRLSDLAQQLQMSNQGAAKIIDEMCDRGYVERVADANDGRAKTLVLAVRGRAALAAARKFHVKYEKKLRAQSSNREVDILRKQLELMIQQAGLDGAPLRAL
ncbi:MAG: MarR family transcriptional regulator [Gemmatimonadaceae bacterium]